MVFEFILNEATYYEYLRVNVNELTAIENVTYKDGIP
jgi:hypothetical protein